MTSSSSPRGTLLVGWRASTCVEIKILRRLRAESSRCPSRHRRDACSMAWRCRFLIARRSQRGHVIGDKGLSEELSGAPDTLIDFHTGQYLGGSPPRATPRRVPPRGPRGAGADGHAGAAERVRQPGRPLPHARLPRPGSPGVVLPDRDGPTRRCLRLDQGRRRRRVLAPAPATEVGAVAALPGRVSLSRRRRGLSRTQLRRVLSQDSEIIPSNMSL